MNTAWFSLKRRLLMLLLGGVAAAWLGTFVFSYFDAHHEVDELLSAAMVIPLNSPRCYPQYNGSMERSQREIKKTLAQHAKAPSAFLAYRPKWISMN